MYFIRFSTIQTTPKYSLLIPSIFSIRQKVSIEIVYKNPSTYYDYTVDPTNYYENAFLKELCVCVYGEDIGERFGPYKLTSEIEIRFNGDIYDVLNRMLKRLEVASTEDLKTFTQNFARKLIRTYYSMVMVRSQIWTTRLHEQAEVFMHYFPEKESTIRTLLNWIDEPPTDHENVYEFFRREGEWASVNFLKEAKIPD